MQSVWRLCHPQPDDLSAAFAAAVARVFSSVRTRKDPHHVALWKHASCSRT